MLNSIDEVSSMIIGLVLFILIIVGAFWTTKLIGKRYGIKGTSGKNIKIVEKISLNQDKMLLIVKAAGKTMLIGVTNNNIEMLSELDEEKLDMQLPDSTQNMDFSSILKNIINKNPVRKDNEKTGEGKDD